MSFPAGSRPIFWVLLLAGGVGGGFWGFHRAADSADQPPAAISPEEWRRLQVQLERLTPRGLYIVVDTAANRLYLRKGKETLLEAVCSTGSGRQLVSEGRSWTFRTPKGRFRIVSKSVNPVWRKPDWAFLEEGLPVPEDEGERFQKGVLGEYALGFGDGYFIHGTLYTRLLGQNVTHGCIRLGPEDLAFLSRRVSIGTPVLVF